MQKGLHNWPKQLEPCDDVLLKHLEKLRGVYGMQVYDIDPYVGVFQLRENLWAMFVPCTHVMADNWAYLLAGPEKAIFIDNGFGIGDLRGLGEMLTGKPVITAVTHEHGDHYGGSVQWEEIYCHEYCADTLNSMSDEDMERGLHNFMEGKEGTRKYWKDEDVMPFRRFKAIGLKDHETISLGGDHELEVLHVGGHAQGLCCFLDKKNRYLFTGDSIYEGRECGVGTVLTGARPGMKRWIFIISRRKSKRSQPESVSMTGTSAGMAIPTPRRKEHWICRKYCTGSSITLLVQMPRHSTCTVIFWPDSTTEMPGYPIILRR